MFTIDKMSRTPIYEQLIEQFETCILSGDIGADGQLPSVRTLSQSLNVNPNTLQRAYIEIERRGLCYTVPGSGRYISKDALENIRSSAAARMGELETLLSELKNRGVTEEAVNKTVAKVYQNDSMERKVATE
jgi:GntR family transcriptional regulator